MLDPADRPAVIAVLDDVWSAVSELGHSLPESAWSAPTDLDGWTAKDLVSHLIGIECQLAGRPEPAHVLPEDLAHIRNDFGRTVEVAVDLRRPVPAAAVLAEWDDVRAERLAQLHALDDDAWAADSWTPVGPGTYGLFMAVRIVDCFVHEQDLRRAVDRPGRLDSPAAGVVADRLLGGLPMVVGKRAAAPPGATVVLQLTGPLERTVAVGVDEASGRAQLLAAPPASPTATISMGSESHLVLATGRRPASSRTDIAYGGDAELGERVVAGLNTMI